MFNKIPQKSLMGIFTFILIIIAFFSDGKIVFNLIIALLTTIILDLILTYIKEKRFYIPSSAVITGLLIGGILPSAIPFYIPLIASVLAILSKHFIIINKRHIFNPASFGLLVILLIFSISLVWNVNSNLYLVILFGLMLSYKIKRLDYSITYLISHIIFSSLLAVYLKESILPYILTINFFFAFFMFIEPITSPSKRKSRIILGILAGLLSVILLQLIPKYDHSILTLIIINLLTPILDRKLSAKQISQ
ncbi:MAG TPA: RnfABCDGE type electron transport complex subunit D [Candidatus Nanoarchaeia archaeon]|nr:RnfABCDGE type electron transport complex subunit D [Candidatus Nanoarchaeia archaeon]